MDNAVRTGVFVVVALLISWIDSARRRAEAELRRHAMQQAAVAELGQRALWGISLSELTDKAVSVLARRLDAGSAVFWEFSPEDNSLAARLSAGQAAYGCEAAVVLGDRERLQQVVWNLLSNAVKFTPEGGRVEVRVEKAGASAQITVSDTGRGINADLPPHVFERFRQGESVGVGRSRGLGLGLSIVRHIVEAHGGTVTAESRGEGLGATFRVRLPLPLPETPGARSRVTEIRRNRFGATGRPPHARRLEATNSRGATALPESDN
ncbi:MAG TPA: ATP-binding protein [Pyrinomonadaceae bacterium]|nr:ATP-binding protein [Pyrinomonadaceae bacterium]